MADARVPLYFVVALFGVVALAGCAPAATEPTSAPQDSAPTASAAPAEESTTADACDDAFLGAMADYYTGDTYTIEEATPAALVDAGAPDTFLSEAGSLCVIDVYSSNTQSNQILALASESPEGTAASEGDLLVAAGWEAVEYADGSPTHYLAPDPSEVGIQIVDSSSNEALQTLLGLMDGAHATFAQVGRASDWGAF